MQVSSSTLSIPSHFLTPRLLLPLTHTFPFYFFKTDARPIPLLCPPLLCLYLQISALNVLHLVPPIFLSFFSHLLSFLSLSSHAHFSPLLLFYYRLSSLCSFLSLSGSCFSFPYPISLFLLLLSSSHPLTVHLIPQPPPSILFPLAPLLPSTLLSCSCSYPSLSLSGHQPHTWLIDF